MKSKFKLWLASVLGKNWHHFQCKCVSAFFMGAYLARSFVLAKVGRYAAVTNNAYPRHGIKRLNRFLKNDRISFEKMTAVYVEQFKRFIKNRKQITLAIDWTVFKEKYMLFGIGLVGKRRRTIPVAFNGYKKGAMGELQSQNKIEMELLMKLLVVVPMNTKVTIIADRGFCRPEFARFLMTFRRKNIFFVIRVSSETYIYKEKKRIRIAKDMIQEGEEKNYGWVDYSKKHRVRVRFVAKWKCGAGEPWLLITNIPHVSTQQIVSLYKKRMHVETMFKSMKNDQVGFHLKHVRLQHIERWVRLLFLVTLFFQFLYTIANAIADEQKLQNYFTLARHKRRRKSFNIYLLIVMALESGRIEIVVRSRRIVVKIT